MAIRVSCGTCQKSLNVKDEHAGRSAKCPHCGARIMIPPASGPGSAVNKVGSQPPALPKGRPSKSPAEERVEEPVPPVRKRATAASNPNEFMREVLASFEGEFPRVRPTLGYRLAALFVAAVMIVLPLLYVALIALSGYGLYWHATSNITILTHVRGANAGKFAAFLYLGPLVIGGILILFMIKPLFARSAKRLSEIELSCTDEPILHSFVQRLCKAVNAPYPSLIEVDCEVNAAAYFRKDWRGFLRNDLVLRIGLPLFAGLNTRQLAGVLAHELGHFSQGAGMRLSYIIRSINYWFERVIYERDELDEWLDEWFQTDNGWLAVLAGLTSLFVALTRGILWLLMMIGHLVSSVLLRQMEYDADKYEARLAGSEVFESTTRRMAEFGLADMLTRQIIGANHDRVGLPDNLPKCLSRIARKLPPAMSAIAHHMVDEETTSWFASHPASQDRIAAARRQEAPGIFRMERPGTVLLKDYKKVAEAATFLFFRRIFGKASASEQLVSTTAFLSQVEFHDNEIDS